MIKTDKLPTPVKKMIARVMKKKELKNESEAMVYMLTIATGRLAALWRYDDSLPEGKTSKGVMVPGRRKRAERKAPISTIIPKANA